MAVTAVLFSDLVDSTGLLSRLGDDAAHTASNEHLALLRAEVARHGGDEVKSLGDGLLVSFSSVSAAVACGVAMQQAVAPTGLGLRVGIDAGEPIEADGDLFGTTVVVARRLCDSAASGELLVSAVVRALAGARIGHPTTSRGLVALKGLPDPVDTWAVDWGSDAAARRSRIGVVIVDDQRLVRAGFRVILEEQPDIEVLGDAADGDEGVEVVTALQPDVVLMDIRMPRLNGLDAARQLLKTTSSRIVILTTFDADEYVYAALKMGASGFLLKDAPPDRLVTAVRCAASGEALIDPAVTQRLIEGFARPAAVPLPDLTAREEEVLRLVCRGLSNAEIAAELVVEETTVKTHVARVLQKLQVRDRVQAVVKAYESGFVGATS